MTALTPKDFETVIGLEVHLQFNTQTKIFCTCANTFGRDPNTCVCPVCLGLPGTLPVLNQAALESAIKTALALQCQVNRFIKFDRKNYYYPDLPKGYQISQYDFPIGYDGFLDICLDETEKRIRIHRAHLEEDAGKLMHDQEDNASLVDYNRTGTPLMEIVSEPDLSSPDEAYAYLTALKLTLQYLDVSDCDMEKGSLRCDANISIRPKGQKELGVKVEIKNLNSFKAVKASLEFEEKRQFQVLASGKTLVQETRLWDENKQVSFSMRTKEEAHDYRYFPEPDLVPFTVTEDDIQRIQKTLPEDPFVKCARFQKDHGLSAYDATILVHERSFADFFESCVSHTVDTKKLVNWMNGQLLKELKDRKTVLKETHLSPQSFVDLINKVEDGTISNLAGKEILPQLFENSKTVEAIIAEKGLAQVSDDSAIAEIVDAVIADNPNVIQQIQDGNHGAMGFLIGQAMKQSQGKANPKKVGDLLKRRILNA